VTKQRGPTDKAEPLAGHITGHNFRNPALLKLALTHSSLAYEKTMAKSVGASPAKSASANHAPADNEQLEFVGDAVLGLIVAETLYRRFPHLREGDLTRLRSSLVSRKHLGEAAAAMKLGEHLHLGKGEERTGGRRKPALLANALEAVVAALYLDGGLTAAAAFVDQYIVQPALPALAAEIGEGGAIGDWKSALQEHLQANGAGHARYAVTAESGPDHQKCFSVELRLEKDGSSSALSSATAATKKEAQQMAAKSAYEKLRGKAKR
jgi:ribonuclease-3